MVTANGENSILQTEIKKNARRRNATGGFFIRLPVRRCLDQSVKVLEATKRSAASSESMAAR